MPQGPQVPLTTKLRFYFFHVQFLLPDLELHINGITQCTLLHCISFLHDDAHELHPHCCT